jgi:WD40 repeat protein
MGAITTRRYFDQAAFQRGRLRDAAEATTTFYDVAFAGDGNNDNDPPPLLLAADSQGMVRAYLSSAVAATWLTAREAEPSSDPVFAWRAHDDGACYRLVLMPRAGLALTAGDDGRVRGWRLSEIGEAAAAAAARRREEEEEQKQEDSEEQRRPASATVRRRPPLAPTAPLSPAFELRLPNPNPRHPPPAAQALACDDHPGREPAAFFGGSDGGIYGVWGLGDGRAEPSSPFGGGSGGGGGVLALDVCPATGALASGGEDGVVRVWASASQQQQQQQPVVSFVAGREVATAVAGGLPGAAAGAATSGAATASTTASSYVSSLKFDSGTGGWLVAGTGAGEIELYSLPMRALARRAAAAASNSGNNNSNSTLVPQALLLRPGEILAAGTCPALVSHRFSLDPPSELARCSVATDSAFALASSQRGGGGVVAVAGSGATIELLSAQFTRLGLVQPPPSSSAVEM